MLSGRTKPNRIQSTLNERVLDNIEHSKKMFETAREGINSIYLQYATQIVDLVRASDSNSQLLGTVKEIGMMVHQPYVPTNAREIYMHAFIEAAIHKKSFGNVQEYIFDSCFGYIGNSRLKDSEVLLLFILKTKAEANKEKHGSLSKHTQERINALLLGEHLRREINEEIVRHMR